MRGAPVGRYFWIRYFGQDGRVARVRYVFGTRERAAELARESARGCSLWIMEAAA